MMFKFVVRKLRWLARIPLLPQLFDAGLVIATMLFDRPRLRAMEMFENAVCRKHAIQRRPHRFGGVAFLSEQQKSVIFMETACSTCLLESHFGPTK